MAFFWNLPLKQSRLRSLSIAVWPDVYLKSSQNLRKVTQKLPTQTFTRTMMFSKIAQKVTMYFGNFVRIFLPRTFKSRPIWSHCAIEAFAIKIFWHFWIHTKRLFKRFFSSRWTIKGRLLGNSREQLPHESLDWNHWWAGSSGSIIEIIVTPIERMLVWSAWAVCQQELKKYRHGCIS